MHQWQFGNIGYFVSDSMSHQDVSCASIDAAGRVHWLQCVDYEYVPCALCERLRFPTTGHRIELPVPSNSTVHFAHTVCPSGHLTHEFLACDAKSSWWQHDSFRTWSRSQNRRNMTSPCLFPFTELFTCKSSKEDVPYTMVCDHGKDCQDNSDEDFCIHPSCNGVGQFQCYNKQAGFFFSFRI